MRIGLKPLLMAALLATTLAPGANAAAMTQPDYLGTFSGSSSANFGRSNISGNFSDYYSFALAGSKEYQITISGSNVSNPELTLYSGVYNTGSQIGSEIPASFYQGPKGSFFTVTSGDLNSGSYYFDFAGSGASSSRAGSTGTYAGTLAISAVPLPPALPMFGAALLGLLGFSLFRTKKEEFRAAA